MKYRHLTQEERYLMAKLDKDGFSYTEIGNELNRHKSTIKREIERTRESEALAPNRHMHLHRLDKISKKGQ